MKKYDEPLLKEEEVNLKKKKQEKADAKVRKGKKEKSYDRGAEKD